jgi:hypothetical protein
VPVDGDELRRGARTLARAGELRPGWGPGPGATGHVFTCLWRRRRAARAKHLDEHQHGTRVWPPGARCRHLAGVEGAQGRAAAGDAGVRRREMQGAPSMRDSRSALAGDVGVSVDAGQQG